MIPIRKSTHKFMFRGHNVGSLGRKFFYECIGNTEKPICVGLWERKLGILIKENHWENIHCLNESRLRATSWKIIHNIYPTNILLFKMKLATSQNCQYCNLPDYIEHFFFQCEKVKKLWINMEKDIMARLGAVVKITLEMVLLGAPTLQGVSKNHLKVINHLLAIGRMVISKFRYGKPRNILEIYETDCSVRKIWTKILT